MSDTLLCVSPNVGAQLNRCGEWGCGTTHTAPPSTAMRTWHTIICPLLCVPAPPLTCYLLEYEGHGVGRQVLALEQGLHGFGRFGEFGEGAQVWGLASCCWGLERLCGYAHRWGVAPGCCRWLQVVPKQGLRLGALLVVWEGVARGFGLGQGHAPTSGADHAD